MLAFYSGKRVLLTGHTGFKGSWLSRILVDAGAELVGYSLAAPTQPSLFEITSLHNEMESICGDIRDRDHLKKVFSRSQPEIVIHMAAQPLVRDGYKDPVYTYETNVMGTLNLLECVRQTDTVKSLLNVTTDKVYLNREWEWGYREDECLDGFDPYSNSKSCSELITHSYNNSYLKKAGVAVSTARAGNVIGGGDFSANRIIPDCVRAIEAKIPIAVRNPHSTRPYQHVLEPLMAYLMVVKEQYENNELADYYNIGPDDRDCVTTETVVSLFCSIWGSEASWVAQPDESAPHEANFLKLDCSRIKQRFGWRPQWSIKDAIRYTCDWTRTYFTLGDINEEMRREVNLFLNKKAVL